MAYTMRDMTPLMLMIAVCVIGTAAVFEAMVVYHVLFE